MLRIKEIDSYKNILQIREFDFGVFFYFEGIVVAELREDVDFTWKIAEKAIKATYEFFPDNTPFVFITNRVNNYRVSPVAWIQFFINRKKVAYPASVGEIKMSYFAKTLKRLLFTNTITQFQDLEEAMIWAKEKVELLKEEHK